jgi:hypothetical protein
MHDITQYVPENDKFDQAYNIYGIGQRLLPAILMGKMTEILDISNAKFVTEMTNRGYWPKVKK